MPTSDVFRGGKQRWYMPYLLVIISTAAMTYFRHLLTPWLGNNVPFVTFFFSVVLCARFGGWAPAVLAMVLGAFISCALFVRPLEEFDLRHFVGITLFVIISIGAIVVIETAHIARKRVAEQAAVLEAETNVRRETQEELKRANEMLEERVRTRTSELADANVQLQQEIAARKQAEASERRLAAIVRSSSDAIIGINLNGEITDWNEGAEHLYGYLAAEVIGKPFARVLQSERADELLNIFAKVKRGEHVEPFESLRRRKNGTQVTVGGRISPIVEDGRLVGVSSISHDLSYTKQLEEQLRHAAKMEAVGRLAGGVAHDFNNLLTAIIGHSDALRNDEQLAEGARERAEAICHAAERGARRTAQLLAYSRKQILQPKILDLNLLVSEAESMARHVLGDTIQLDTCLDDNLGPIRADPVQVEHVLLNLLENARDAMPKGGKVSISTKNVDLEEYPPEVLAMTPGTSYNNDRWVLLEVSDTGEGIDPAMQKHIFEPFYTTKELSKGTGLGLATVYGIVRQSGGFVAVDSIPGVHTTFRVYLPRLEGSLESVTPREAAQAIPQGSETILLVEDDDMVRQFTRTLLQMNGYLVVEADDGAVALERSAAHAGPIHLLLTDVVMPGMNGRQLAEKLVQSRPETKVLYVSGYNEDAILRLGINRNEAPFLQKPFSPADLTRKVREVLEGQGVKRH